jgi:hypothetical protein
MFNILTHQDYDDCTTVQDTDMVRVVTPSCHGTPVPANDYENLTYADSIIKSQDGKWQR